MATKKKRIIISVNEDLYNHILYQCDNYSCTKSEFICSMLSFSYAEEFHKKHKAKHHFGY